MRKTNRAALPLAVLAAISMPAWAAEPALLTWETAVTEAEQYNPSLAAAKSTVLKAEAALKASYSAFLPSLSANGSYSLSDTETSLQAKQYSMGLSGRQSLFSGFRDKATLDRRRAELDSAQMQQRAAQAQVSYDLRRSFSDLLYAQERVVLADSIASRRKENLRLLELRFEAGKEHKGSYLRIKAAYRDAEFEAARSKRALQVGQRALAAALGRANFGVLVATGSLQLSPETDDPDYDSLVRQTPEYRRASAQVLSAQAGVTISRSQFVPELSASASGSRSAETWPPYRDRWSTGLSISLPLFSGGQDYQGVKGAKAEERRAAAALADLRNELALKLQNSFISMQDAAEKTEVQKEFLAAAEVRAEISRSQYTSGLLDFDDWDIIENDLIDKQKTMLSSLKDASVAVAGWELAKGVGVIR